MIRARAWAHISVELTDRVLTITLDRPQRLNALTFDSYAELRDLFTGLASEEGVGAAVITGAGRGFCSGGDVAEIIGELQRMQPAELLRFTRLTGAVVKAVRECHVPVIGAINGVAAGAGSVIALACDFRLMARSASFAFLFTRVGLSGADMGAAYLLPRLIGLGPATELLMLGDNVTPERAKELQLVNDVVDEDELAQAAAALARRLADGPSWAYGMTKTMLTRELDVDLATAIEMEALTQALLMKSHDHGEFFAAWSDKREPRWEGR